MRKLSRGWEKYARGAFFIQVFLLDARAQVW